MTRLSLLFVCLVILNCTSVVVVADDDFVKEYELQCWPKEQNEDKIDEKCSDLMVEDINTKIHEFMCENFGNDRRNLRINNLRASRELLSYQCKQMCMGWSPTYCGVIYPWCKRRLEAEEVIFADINQEVSYPSSSYIVEVDTTTFDFEGQQNHRHLGDKTCNDRIKALRELIKGVEKHYKDIPDPKVEGDDYKDKDFNNDGIIDDVDKELGEELKKQAEEDAKLVKEKNDQKEKCAKLLTNIVCKCIFTWDNTSVIDDGTTTTIDDGTSN